MKKYAISVGVSLLPFLALAADGDFTNIFRAVDTVQGLIIKLIPIVIGAAVLVFLWGILQFVLARKDDDRAAARNFMVFGVAALFVMVSVWGLVNFFRNTLGVTGGTNTPPPAPRLPSY